MPNELSEKVYPDGTVVKLRDDTAREQIANLTKSGLGSNVNVLSYTATNPYVCPSDGYFYIQLTYHANQTIVGYVNNVALLQLSTPTSGNNVAYQSICTFVRKGMQIQAEYRQVASGGAVFAFFIPLE